MHRRGALAVLGTAVLSGCTGSWIDLGGLITDTEPDRPSTRTTVRQPERLARRRIWTRQPTEPAPPEACVDPGLSQPGMSATDATPDDPVTMLAVAYFGRLQTTIDTDPDTSGCRQPPKDVTFLVVKIVITNTGDEPFRLGPQLFVAEVKGVRYDPVVTSLQFEDLNRVAITPPWNHYRVDDLLDSRKSIGPHDGRGSVGRRGARGGRLRPKHQPESRGADVGLIEFNAWNRSRRSALW